MKKFFLPLLFLLLFFSFLIEPIQTNAFMDGLNKTAQGTGHPTGDGGIQISQMIGKVLKTLLSLIGIFFLGLIIYGGYTWMLARGNEAETRKAKDILIRAVIGLIIITAAFGITAFIGGSLTEVSPPVQE